MYDWEINRVIIICYQNHSSPSLSSLPSFSKSGKSSVSRHSKQKLIHRTQSNFSLVSLRARVLLPGPASISRRNTSPIKPQSYGKLVSWRTFALPTSDLHESLSTVILTTGMKTDWKVQRTKITSPGPDIV